MPIYQANLAIYKECVVKNACTSSEQDKYPRNRHMVSKIYAKRVQQFINSAMEIILSLYKAT